MRYPLRPFTVTFQQTPKSIQADLRDHTGTLWSFVNDYTYGECMRRIEAIAFGFGGEVVAYR